MSHYLKNILLVGTGPMAVEYVKVLRDLDVSPHVVGRSQQACAAFEEKTGIKAVSGGLENQVLGLYDGAIVCTGVEQLANCTLYCLHAGIKNILVEKPAGLYQSDIQAIADLAEAQQANVLVAYNRRFYASVLAALEGIEADGGVSSFHFEFTEWSHTIEPLQKAAGVKERWLVANSSHVIDLAFLMGGEPQIMHSMADGNLSWHAKSSFVGMGKSDKGALFSYQANWNAPGRWSVEILTQKNKYIFRPLEQLQLQAKGSVQVVAQVIDDSLDKKYKAGLFLQTKYWLLQENKLAFLTIHQQLARFKIYDEILNGNQE